MKTNTLKEIAKYSKQIKKEGKSVGLVVGSFDILHLGHLNLFRLAKEHVDFLIERISKHGSEGSIETLTDLLNKIKPTHIFTHVICDRHWKEKEKLAKKLGVTCVLDESEKITNSGTIIDILELEL